MTGPRFRGVALGVVLTTLVTVGGCGRSADADATSGGSPTGGAPSPSSVASFSGTLTGLYVDVAGGPIFSECGGSRQWPVVAGGVSKELDRAYFSVRDEPGDPARVTVQAHSVSGSGAGKAGLVIDKVVMLTGETVCPGQQADAPLAGTTWRAVSLNGRVLSPDQGVVTIRLDDDTKSLQVTTACQALSGTFRWVGTQLTFGSIDAGAARCPPNAATDVTSLYAGVMDVLRATGSYAIRGDTLELMGEHGVLARLAAAG